MLGYGMLQFGHDLTVVENSASARTTARSANSLQFGHDLTVVENSFDSAGMGQTRMLQFGHDLKSWRTL